MKKRPKKQKMTNAVRAIWKRGDMEEGRYALTAGGLQKLIDDTAKYGKPHFLEVYHEDPHELPDRRALS